jgi:translation initiation factor IF-3
LRVNKEIRVPKVRVIDQTGAQLGIMSTEEALQLAYNAGLDLIEIVATAAPPVCKIMDQGKFRYDQTKKEKESKKSRHQIKVKEIKLKPHTDDHDLDFKRNHARKFLTEGDKVKVTCTFRGREMMYPDLGEKILSRFCSTLDDVATIEAPTKLVGKIMSLMLSPGGKKKTLPAGTSPSSTPPLPGTGPMPTSISLPDLEPNA